MSGVGGEGPAEFDELDAQRVQAIAASGWGARVALVQPRNLAMWVWVVVVVLGAWRGWHILAGDSYYAPAASLALGLFALYGAVFWWFTQRIDRYASLPVLVKVIAFGWGAFGATFFIAVSANDALLSIYAKLFGQPFALDWGASLAAPFTEEWGKGVGVLLLIAWAPRVIRTAYDGFVLGAFIGLGFQILEDILYVVQAAPSRFGSAQIAASLPTIGGRMATGVASHIVMSAIFCTGFLYLLGRPAQPRRPVLGAVLILTAMAFHGLWDGQDAIAGALFGHGSGANATAAVMMVGIPIVGLVMVAVLFRSVVKPERAVMGVLLAPEVARGTVTRAEAEAAAGNVRARHRFVKKSGMAGRRRGRRRRNRHVLGAVFDLADELGRAEGESTERVVFARGEVARLRSRAAA